MDLGDVECRKCREAGVLVAVNTDAHSPGHLGRIEFALAMARRGWLEARNVLNTYPLATLLERRRRRLREHAGLTFEPVFAVPVVQEPDEEDAHAWGDEEEASVAESEPPMRAAQAFDVEPLLTRLLEGDIDDTLRERLGRFLLAADQDPELEAALAQKWSNPLMVAFHLANGMPAPPPDRPSGVESGD
jgi:DNA polymerase (family 10)